MSKAGIYHYFQSFLTVIIISNTKGYIFHSWIFPLAANQALAKLSCMCERVNKLTNHSGFELLDTLQPLHPWKDDCN